MAMSLHPFEAVLEASWPVDRWKMHGVVVAVSGGADSVALLRGLVAVATRRHAPTRLTVAHFNHGWRGDASDEDERFVGQLARELALPIQVGRPQPTDSARGQSREGLARRQRYAFLAQVARQHSARYVVTAHTRDDQVETILARILRGTGIDGLAGIPVVRPFIPHVALVRPLLRTERAEGMRYLRDHGWQWRSDVSNDDRRYERARLRHDLLPLLRSQFNPHVDEALLRLAASADETRRWLDALARDLIESWCEPMTPRGFRLRRSVLDAFPSVALRAALRQLWRQAHWPLAQMHRRRWQDLERVVRGPVGGRQYFPGRVFVDVQPEYVCFTREERTGNGH